MTEEFHDHPMPIVCTCGHHLSKHDLTHPSIRCTACACMVYFTDWPKARKLGFYPELDQRQHNMFGQFVKRT